MVTFGPLNAAQFSAARLHAGEVVSSGFEPLDRLLPAGDPQRGTDFWYMLKQFDEPRPRCPEFVKHFLQRFLLQPEAHAVA